MTIFKNIITFIIESFKSFVNSGLFFPLSMFLIISFVVILLIIIFKEL